MTTENKIQEYLDGELSDTEILAFEEELGKNSSLKKQYDNYLIARDLSKGLLEIDMRETLEKEKGSNVPFPRWVWIVLFLAVLGLGTYFIMPKDNTEATLFAEIYTEPIWPITRSESDSLSAAFAEWKKSGDIKSAKAEIENINSLDSSTKYYWISEMFLYAREKDSVSYYLPNLSRDHMKYDQVQKIRNLLLQLN